MNGTAWSDEEVNALEMHYSSYGLRDIKIPGRSLCAIRKKAQYQMFGKRKTIEDYKVLAMEHPNRSVRWFAKQLGVTERTVQRYRKTLADDTTTKKRYDT